MGCGVHVGRCGSNWRCDGLVAKLWDEVFMLGAGFRCWSRPAVKTYFRLFVVSFKKFTNYNLFYQEPEPAPGRKFPEPEPPHNRPAPKHCTKGLKFLGQSCDDARRRQDHNSQNPRSTKTDASDDRQETVGLQATAMYKTHRRGNYCNRANTLLSKL